MAEWGATHFAESDAPPEWIQLVRSRRDEMTALICDTVRSGGATFAGETVSSQSSELWLLPNRGVFCRRRMTVSLSRKRNGLRNGLPTLRRDAAFRLTGTKTHRVAVAALIGPLGILMCHRVPGSNPYADKWDFPGGHIEDGETPGEALARELFEEINVEIVPPTTAPSFSVRINEDSPEGLSLDGYILNQWSGDIENIAIDEHAEVKWFTPARALALDLAHAGYVELLHYISDDRSSR